jgi:outer membrane protein assembly factor BamB
LDRDSGGVEWTFECESFTKNRPVIAGERLYFGNWDRRVRCLDRRTGEPVWEREVATHPLFPCATSNPLPVGSLLIVATHDYNVRALSLETGERVWFHEKTDTAKPSYSSPALFEGTAIFGSITGHVLGLDTASGEEVFNTRVNEPGDALFDSSPCLVGDRFYCGSVGGFVYGADARTGEITWRFRPTGANIFSTPASDGEYLYVGGMDGRMYVLSLPGE